MRHDHRFQVPTEAPASWQEFYKQRGKLFFLKRHVGKTLTRSLTICIIEQKVRSWDIGEHFRASQFLCAVWTTRHTTATGTFVLKWFQLYYCFCAALEWIRVPLLGLCLWFGLNATAVAFVVLALASTAVMLIWDRLSTLGHFPQKPTRWKVILTFQLFKIFEQFQRYLGWGKAYFEFLPNYKTKPTVLDFEQEFGDENNALFDQRCPVWLCPRDSEYGHYFYHYDPNEPTRTQPRPLRQFHLNEKYKRGPSTAVPSKASLEHSMSNKVTVNRLAEEETVPRGDIVEILHRGQASVGRVQRRKSPSESASQALERFCWKSIDSRCLSIYG